VKLREASPAPATTSGRRDTVVEKDAIVSDDQPKSKTDARRSSGAAPHEIVETRRPTVPRAAAAKSSAGRRRDSRAARTAIGVGGLRALAREEPETSSSAPVAPASARGIAPPSSRSMGAPLPREDSDAPPSASGSVHAAVPPSSRVMGMGALVPREDSAPPPSSHGRDPRGARTSIGLHDREEPAAPPSSRARDPRAGRTTVALGESLGGEAPPSSKGNFQPLSQPASSQASRTATVPLGAPLRELGAPSREPAPAAKADTAASSQRGTEVAQLHAKVAALQAELAGAEELLATAHKREFAEDEMVGTMLARLAEVESQRSEDQAQAAEAAARAQTAEARVVDMAAHLGKLRSAHAEATERLHTAATRQAQDRLEIDRLRAERAATRRELEVAQASAAEARDALARGRAEAEALQGKLASDQEELESLRARVAELTAACEQRDQTLARRDAVEAALETTRRELAETQRHAMSGEHRLSDQLRYRDTEIEQFKAEVQHSRAHVRRVEKELWGARRELELLHVTVERGRRTIDASGLRVSELLATTARHKQLVEDAQRARAAAQEELASARGDIEGLTAQCVAAERRAAEASAALDALRAEHERIVAALPEADADLFDDDRPAARTP
jgi:hypothetical protein